MVDNITDYNNKNHSCTKPQYSKHWNDKDRNWFISRLETGTEMLQDLNWLMESQSRYPADKEILYNQAKEKLQSFVSIQFKILHTFTEMMTILS